MAEGKAAQALDSEVGDRADRLSRRRKAQLSVQAIKADLLELAVTLHNDKGRYTTKTIFGPSIIAADRVMPTGARCFPAQEAKSRRPSTT